jgi:cation/acetate symporter
VGVGALSIVLALSLRTLNVAFLVGLAFAVAASANVPAILLTLYWRRFTTQGMITGMIVGLLASVILIVVSPAVMGVDAAGAASRHLIQHAPLFPLDNPALISVPLGFLAAVVASLLAGAPDPERYTELNVRANTGLGAA